MIEIVDRYSATGTPRPHGLTVCGGHCEGMGVYPVLDPEAVKEVRPAEPPTDAELRAIADIKAERGPEEDGWYFIQCGACNGSRKCGRWESVRRIPGWLWKAARFMWDTRPGGYYGGGTSLRQRLKIAVTS